MQRIYKKILFLAFALFVPGATLFFTQESFWQGENLHAGHRGLLCSDCHTPFQGVDSEKCSACHYREGYDSVHPYPMMQADCVLCHQEHQGTKGLLTLQKPLREDKWCLSCHPSPHKNPKAAIVQATKIPVPIRRSFNHEVHFQKVEKLSCQECHKASENEKQDFFPISYESCLACHQDKKVAKHGDWGLCQECHATKDKVVSPLLQRQSQIETVIESITMGGFHENLRPECKECHRGKQIPLPLQKNLSFRHDQHASVQSTKQECIACHEGILKTNFASPSASLSCDACHQKPKELTLLTREKTSEKFAFNHAEHLAIMEKKAGQAAVYSQGCFACHETQEGNFRPLPQEKSCRLCHRNHQNYEKSFADLSSCSYCHSGILKPNLQTPTPRLRLYPAFSHKQTPHQHLACEECHTEKSLTKLTESPSLSAESCTLCHDQKEDKTKACSECHGYHKFFAK